MMVVKIASSICNLGILDQSHWCLLRDDSSGQVHKILEVIYYIPSLQNKQIPSLTYPPSRIKLKNYLGILLSIDINSSH